MLLSILIYVSIISHVVLFQRYEKGLPNSWEGRKRELTHRSIFNNILGKSRTIQRKRDIALGPILVEVVIRDIDVFLH